MPAIQLVQAPVFYGYAFSAYAEFAISQCRQSNSREAFANLGVKIAAPDDPAPTNVSVAGESEIHFARIEADPSVAAGVWLWGVADNLRLAATNAVRIAEELVARVRAVRRSCGQDARMLRGSRWLRCILRALAAIALRGMRISRGGARGESSVGLEDDRRSRVHERHDAVSHRAAVHARP